MFDVVVLVYKNVVKDNLLPYLLATNNLNKQ